MKRQSGFTLFELLTIIAIMGVLAALAVPNFVAYRSNQRLGAGAREILTAIRDARMYAIRTQVRTIIMFDMDEGSYFAFVNDGTGTEDEDKNDILDGAENSAYDEGEPIIARGTLPADIVMTNASFAGGVPRTEFNMRGMATGFGGNVVIQNRRGNRLQITLRITGSANIHLPED